jgi:hypothetical protein
MRHRDDSITSDYKELATLLQGDTREEEGEEIDPFAEIEAMLAM